MESKELKMESKLKVAAAPTNRLRLRFRLKRNLMFCIWTLLFIYYNLNSDERMEKRSGFCAEAFSVGAADDAGFGANNFPTSTLMSLMPANPNNTSGTKDLILNFETEKLKSNQVFLN